MHWVFLFLNDRGYSYTTVQVGISYVARGCELANPLSDINADVDSTKLSQHMLAGEHLSANIATTTCRAGVIKPMGELLRVAALRQQESVYMVQSSLV